MTKRDKLRQKLRNNSTNVKFQQLETLLLRFKFRRVRVQGSHHMYEYKQGDIEGVFVVPTHGNWVKPLYVQNAVELIDKLFPEVDETDLEQNHADNGGTE
jgi:predicted RNA binding protein YcfA (HicA-like mRNA interferase family)